MVRCGQVRLSRGPLEDFDLCLDDPGHSSSSEMVVKKENVHL